MIKEIVLSNKLKVVEVLYIYKKIFSIPQVLVLFITSFLLLIRHTVKRTVKMHPIEKLLGVRRIERFLWNILRMTEGSCFVLFFSSANSIQEN